MNRSARHSRITLILLFTALLWPRGLAGAQTPSPSPTPAASPAASPSASPRTAASPQATLPPPDPTDASEKVKLYYMRQATNINKMLTDIGTSSALLNGLVIKNSTEDELVLFGSRGKRDNARRLIAALDLPRPGVIMEMWGIQITSKKPDEMAQALALVRQEINRTQQAVRDTYRHLESLTIQHIPNVSTSDPGKPGLNEPFRKVLEDDLFYHSALRLDHQLSLADILLRMTAANNPGAASVEIARDMEKWLNDNYSIYVNEMNRQAEKAEKKGKNKENDKEDAVKQRTPFERFFTGRGLTREANKWEDSGEIDRRAQIARFAVLDFAFRYGQLIHDPRNFSPYYLQQASEALNTRLQNATDAINLDMQDLFVEPTLERIRRIVRDFKNVEYAQIGKTTVASLSGVQADVTTKAVNNFEVTPPLTLTEVLTKAKTISDSVNGFIPKPADNLVGGMPLSQFIGLIAAFGDDRTVFRELQAGISLSITPNVLRNMTSAELKLDLKIGDPQQTTPPDKVKPLSRVAQHNVNTSIYIDPLDFFDLSTFANQSTLDGGRGYVPIIGPVWRGLFGEIPIAGKIFSWKRGTQNILNQSMVLTNSYITPTSMGLAVLYPTDLFDEQGKPVTYNDDIGKCQWKAVWDYRHTGTITVGKTCLRPNQ